MDKIPFEIWSKLTKSQKRAARKKLAEKHVKAAVSAAARRDADLVARITGSLTGTSKGSVPKMFKLSKEEKSAILTVNKVEQAVSRNNAWNAAECLTACLEKSRFEEAVKTKTFSSQKVLNPALNQGEKVQALKDGKTAMEIIRTNFEDVKKLFTLDTAFDTLNAVVMTAKNRFAKAGLEHDEAVKAGKNSGIAKKNLDTAREEFESAKAALDNFLKAESAKL